MDDSLHIYDWLAIPAKDDGEKLAKEWLDQFTRPAMDKDNEWLEARVLSCDYQGESYICSGASRLGDVWLRKRGSKCYYDIRVNVEECSNWSRVDSSDAPPKPMGWRWERKGF